MFAEVHKLKKKKFAEEVFHPPLQENNGPSLSDKYPYVYSPLRSILSQSVSMSITTVTFLRTKTYLNRIVHFSVIYLRYRF